MQNDIKLIAKKLKEARKLPENSTTEYNHKQVILNHWKLERYTLKKAIEQDIRTRNYFENNGLHLHRISIF